MQGNPEEFGENDKPEIPNDSSQQGENSGKSEMPDDIQSAGQQNSPPSMPDNDMQKERIGFKDGKASTLNVWQITAIAICSLVFAFCFIYLMMSLKNRAFLKNTDKAIILVLSTVLIATYLTGGIAVCANHYLSEKNNFEEVQTEKDEVSLDKSNMVNSEVIDLSQQTTDVTITKGGSYEIKGEFTNSLLVDAENEEVELILNNVKISNEKTAAIIGLAAKSITVNLKDGTENILSDGGNSEYDGCIFSNAELIFEGNGKLTVNGNQNEGEGIATEAADITINSGEIFVTSNDDGINAGGDGATITVNGGNIYVDASGDGIDSNKNAVINGGTLFVLGSDVGGDAGIDTDEGYVINGGTVVALGSDMIEVPDNTGSQNTLAISLNEKIDKDTMVSLMNNDKSVLSFISPKSFKTIIISSKTLENGEYQLYTRNMTSDTNNYGICAEDEYTTDNPVVVNNQRSFAVNQSVNRF